MVERSALTAVVCLLPAEVREAHRDLRPSFGSLLPRLLEIPDLIEHTVESLLAQRVYGLPWLRRSERTTREFAETIPCCGVFDREGGIPVASLSRKEQP